LPVIYDWNVQIDTDDVLSGQGAVPSVIRKRSPRLITIAEQALFESRKLVRPLAVYKILDVVSFTHDRIELSEGHYLQGEFVHQHLQGVQQVCVAACTITDALQKRVSEIGNNDISYALALDGAGSSSVEFLATEVCKWIEGQAKQKGWVATLPLNPGMSGWPMAEGQKQVFDILSGESDEITLTPSCLMQPFKSLSLVVGLGQKVAEHGSQCDYCTLRDSCQFSKINQRDNTVRKAGEKA